MRHYGPKEHSEAILKPYIPNREQKLIAALEAVQRMILTQFNGEVRRQVPNWFEISEQIRRALDSVHPEGKNPVSY